MCYYMLRIKNLAIFLTDRFDFNNKLPGDALSLSRQKGRTALQGQPV